MPKVSKSFIKEQKPWIKRAMKGRPVHFGIQAAGEKKGKFVVSKKPSECKPQAIKALEIYEDKDPKKAKAANDIKSAPGAGVCHGNKGTLTLFIEKGPEKPAFEKFAKYFISRQMKIKLVKKVVISEVEKGNLPAVPDKDDRDKEKLTKTEVEKRADELATLLKSVGGNSTVETKLQNARPLAAKKPEDADDLIDEVETAITCLGRARQSKDVEIAKQVLAKVNAWDLDAAEDILDQWQSADKPVIGQHRQQPLSEEFKKQWPPAYNSWQSSSKTVNSQLKVLESVLSKHSDPVMRGIASTELNKVTNGYHEKADTALKLLDSAKDDNGKRKAAATAQTLFTDLVKQLGDKRIDVIDRNPFQVECSVKQTLGKAVADMNKVLKLMNN